MRNLRYHLRKLKAILRPGTYTPSRRKPAATTVVQNRLAELENAGSRIRATPGRPARLSKVE
jgi:hypothetical protein